MVTCKVHVYFCVFFGLCFFPWIFSKVFARAEVKHTIYFDWPNQKKQLKKCDRQAFSAFVHGFELPTGNAKFVTCVPLILDYGRPWAGGWWWRLSTWCQRINFVSMLSLDKPPVFLENLLFQFFSSPPPRMIIGRPSGKCGLSWGLVVWAGNSKCCPLALSCVLDLVQSFENVLKRFFSEMS